MMISHGASRAVAIPLGLAVSVALAAAAPGGASPPRKLDLAPLVTAVNGDDVEAAARAAETLGTLALPSAHDALLDALALGPPAPVAVPAIAALARHPAPPDVAMLARYAGHHAPDVRAAALAAIATYPDPTARAVVVAGLHDPVAAVRTAAAGAAATGRVREAEDPLFALLAKGEASAALALAGLADADLARKIADHFGQVPDPALAACLGAILRRPDFGPDTARVEIVRALGKITDASATRALTDYLDATPKNPPRPSRAEAEKLAQTRGGGAP
jgi:HEAT repeat protein